MRPSQSRFGVPTCLSPAPPLRSFARKAGAPRLANETPELDDFRAHGWVCLTRSLCRNNPGVRERRVHPGAC
jgi:hypothetical protein